MQSIILRLSGLFVLLSILFSACKKEDVIKPTPQPPVPAPSFSFQFSVASLPGEPVGGTTTFNAWVSVVDKNNDTIIKNQVLPFQLNGTYKTSQLELPAGEYKLVRFRVTNQNVLTKYAAPMLGSDKASEVTQPLAIAFTLPQSTATLIPVEVAAVAGTDTPERFGYPSKAFDQPDQQRPDESLNFYKIKLAAFAQIGEVRYENLAATVRLTITDNNGQQTTRSIDLLPSSNEVMLPKSARRFQFNMDKWGIQSEVSLDISQIREGELYGIGGSREAKKLKSEVVYKFTNGHYVAESKIEYIYDREGKIGRIDYFKKKQDGRPYIDSYELFEYDNNNVVSIKKYNENNEFSTEMNFTYDAQGKVKTIYQGNGVSFLNAAVTYFQSPNRNNTHIRYTYSHSSHTLDYTMSYQNNNIVESATRSSLGSTQTGTYQYDSNINPFAHLKRPDLYLSGQSKNNVVTQEITYVGNFPQASPYRFDYTYDTDGYPMEMIKYFKVPATNAPSYTLKTVYTYL